MNASLAHVFTICLRLLVRCVGVCASVRAKQQNSLKYLMYILHTLLQQLATKIESKSHTQTKKKAKQTKQSFSSIKSSQVYRYYRLKTTTTFKRATTTMDTDEFRRRGKEMVDFIADYLENIK